jgi:hypothetical protein
MAVSRCCAATASLGAWVTAFAFGALVSVESAAHGADAIVLRESAQVGAVTRFIVELKAEGLSRPAPAPAVPPGLAGSPKSKPLALRVETRFACEERVLKVDSQGLAQRVARHVIQAAAAINGEVRPTASALRPEMGLLVAEVRQGTVLAFSPAGPLTRPELDLVEGPADPLSLWALLPAKAVAIGEHWLVGGPAARSLSGYDALAANTLDATLESADDASAQVKLAGTIRGAALGGEGSILCEGSFTFDRKANRISRLSLKRTEKREPGPVEAGLDIKSTLTCERQAIEPPPELADAALASVPAELHAELEELQYVSPDGKFSLQHDRDWHIFAEDTRQTVLKWLDHGELAAQCNLAAGPHAGKGRHQDLKQFRDDIRRALGTRFGRIIEAGEMEGPADLGFRYRVAVEGHEGDVGVIWIYFLIASPEGDQLLVTFTLGAAQAKLFAEQDLRLVGSLEWKGAGGAEAAAPR